MADSLLLDFQQSATMLWELSHRLTDGLSTAPETEKVTSRLVGDLARFWDDSSQIEILLVDDWDPIHLSVTSWAASQVLGLANELAERRLSEMKKTSRHCCAVAYPEGVKTFRQTDLRKVWGRFGLSSWRVAKKKLQNRQAMSLAGHRIWWIPRE